MYVLLTKLTIHGSVLNIKGYHIPYTVSDPKFQLLKLFDAAAFEEIPGSEEGVPIISAILLHKDKAMHSYTFSMTKLDARQSITDFCN